MQGRGAGLFQAAGSRGLLRAGERAVLHGSCGRGEAQGIVSVVRKANPTAQDAAAASWAFQCLRLPLCPSATSVFSHLVGEGPHSSSPGGTELLLQHMVAGWSVQERLCLGHWTLIWPRRKSGRDPGDHGIAQVTCPRQSRQPGLQSCSHRGSSRVQCWGSEAPPSPPPPQGQLPCFQGTIC